MKKFTSILVVFLLLLALGGQLYSMALYNELRDSVIFLTKQTLHRWLSIRDELEEVGENVQAMVPVESPEEALGTTTEEASETISESQAEETTEEFSEEATDRLTVTEPSETAELTETVQACSPDSWESTSEPEEVTEGS